MKPLLEVLPKLNTTIPSFWNILCGRKIQTSFLPFEFCELIPRGKTEVGIIHTMKGTDGEKNLPSSPSGISDPSPPHAWGASYEILPCQEGWLSPSQASETGWLPRSKLSTISHSTHRQHMWSTAWHLLHTAWVKTCCPLPSHETLSKLFHLFVPKWLSV